MIITVDVETTGLRPEEGHLLLEIQVHVLQPNYPFDEVGKGFHRIVYHDPTEAREKANEYVQAMHEETGLWKLLHQGHPLHLVDTALLEYLQHHVPKGQGRVMGNSVRLDMNFMDAYLPKTMDWLHYRFLDVTGLSWFANENFGVPFYQKDTSKIHTATHDIQESIRELRHVTRELAAKERFCAEHLDVARRRMGTVRPPYHSVRERPLAPWAEGL